jgi:hypothetical protein
LKNSNVARNYFVMPCCILLLNLCVGMVGYKAKMLGDPLLQVAAVIAMVLFGGSMVSFVLSPAIEMMVGALHRGSRRRWGELGEIFFVVLLGVVVFWLYYRMYIMGPEYLLPKEWRNPHHF